MLSPEEKEKIFEDVFFLNNIFYPDDSRDQKKYQTLIKNLIDIVDHEFLLLLEYKDPQNFWNHHKYNHTLAAINQMMQGGSEAVYQRLGERPFDKRIGHTFDFFDDIMALSDVNEHRKITACLKIIKHFIAAIDFYDGVDLIGINHKEALRRFLIEDFQEALKYYWLRQSTKKSPSE